MKIKKALITGMFFLLLFFTVYYLHITFFKVNVVFYSAIIDGVIATVVLMIGLYSIKYFDIFNFFEKIQLSIIMFLISYALSITIPTVIDRSLSFYILEKIQQRGGGVQLLSMKDIFTKEYIVEHRLMDIRITEQLESGTIKIVDNCVLLTNRGEKMADFSRFFRQNLLPKKRLINGKYTDDLVDPFRNSSNIVDYKCSKFF